MDWLRRIFGKKTKAEEAEEVAKLKAAFEMGQVAAQSMANDIDKYIAFRFGHINGSYLGVLENLLTKAIEQTEYSPLIYFRVETDEFLKQMDELRSNMTTDCLHAVSDWRKVLLQIDSEDQTRRYVEFKVEEITSKLMVDATDLILSFADRVKYVDDKWRKANPELSQQQPLE